MVAAPSASDRRSSGPPPMADIGSAGPSLAPGVYRFDRGGGRLATGNRYRSKRSHRPASAIRSSTGNRWPKKASGFSDIGKWPTPTISVNVEPAMAS